jgi:hypothetical protein
VSVPVRNGLFGTEDEKFSLIPDLFIRGYY